MVVEGLRDAIIFGWRFGPRRTRYVPNLRQRVRSRLGLKYNLRVHVGCWCWCDGVMGGDYLRQNGLQRCFPKEQNVISAKPTNAKKERAGIVYRAPSKRGHR